MRLKTIFFVTSKYIYIIWIKYLLFNHGPATESLPEQPLKDPVNLLIRFDLDCK